MELTEIGNKIDALDEEIKALLLQRLACSKEVAEAKAEKGETEIYRADREEAILERLGNDVPEVVRREYLAIVRKIMETSRMYQYGLLYDWNPAQYDGLFANVPYEFPSRKVKILLTRPNRPNAMSSILSMVGDYGYNMEKMELLSYTEDRQAVRFLLTVRGDLSERHMQKLMVQLAGESRDFCIMEVLR